MASTLSPTITSYSGEKRRRQSSQFLQREKLSEKSIRLPDGNMIVMGREQFSAPEILFKPSLANKKSCGLDELIYYSVMKCDESLRGELLNNITLSGGNTKFPGFEKRLYSE